MRGIEPRAFRMQSERSTTELHPRLVTGKGKIKIKIDFTCESREQNSKELVSRPSCAPSTSRVTDNADCDSARTVSNLSAEMVFESPRKKRKVMYLQPRNTSSEFPRLWNVTRTLYVTNAYLTSIPDPGTRPSSSTDQVTIIRPLALALKVSGPVSSSTFKLFVVTNSDLF